ncbi:hypothetical protein LCGC14_2457240 [marine sediment metagenome]|uniref:Uncharacterized protein n=1 Tax=marine sediment metagenome TaxID=412755 RepID=A0A0F9BEB5_9ZZZZ
MSDELPFYARLANADWHIVDPDKSHTYGAVSTMCGFVLAHPRHAAIGMTVVPCAGCVGYWDARQAKHTHVTRHHDALDVDITGTPEAVGRVMKAAEPLPPMPDGVSILRCIETGGCWGTGFYWQKARDSEGDVTVTHGPFSSEREVRADAAESCE